jgi:hypothetical protein
MLACFTVTRFFLYELTVTIFCQVNKSMLYLEQLLAC